MCQEINIKNFEQRMILHDLRLYTIKQCLEMLLFLFENEPLDNNMSSYSFGLILAEYVENTKRIFNALEDDMGIAR